MNFEARSPTSDLSMVEEILSMIKREDVFEEDKYDDNKYEVCKNQYIKKTKSTSSRFA